jgi:protein-disulfide isomerase
MGTQARIRAREQRQAAAVAAARRARNRTRWLAGVGAVVIVGLVVAIVLAVIHVAGKGGTPSAQGSDGSAAPLVVPAGATTGGAILIGKSSAPVRVEIYLDYMCPYCGRFERANGADLQRLLADGTIRVEMHPLAFLDRASSGSRYSTRAANALVTVADGAPDKILAFNQALYANQPDENTPGLSDDEIAKRALDAGVPQAVVDTFGQLKFQPWVAKFNDLAFKGGITSTPTVKINGTLFEGDLYHAGPFTQAITNAKGQQQ